MHVCCIRVFRDGCRHRVLNVLYVQAIIDCGVLPRLRNLLNSSTNDIRGFVCRTIYKLINNDGEETTQAVIEANILPPLIRAIPCAMQNYSQVQSTLRPRAGWDC